MSSSADNGGYYCALRKRCEDYEELYEDESLNNYKQIIGCPECHKENEEWLFHPVCFNAKHEYFPKSLRERHEKKKTTMNTAVLQHLAKAKRKMKVAILHNSILGVAADATWSGVMSMTPHLAHGLASFGVASIRSGAAGGAINLVDEMAQLAVNVGPGASIAMGVAASAILCSMEVGYSAYQWSCGTITSKEFKMQSISAVVGNLSAFSCSTIGALIGNAVLPGLGTIIGGVLGAIAGVGIGYAGRKLVEYGFDHHEDTDRAELIIEAFSFLNCPALHLIDQSVVQSCFRKKAIFCHPDSGKVQAMDDQGKAIAKMEWLLLQHAKDVALGYLKNKNQFSRNCKDRIQKGMQKGNLTSFDKLRESFENVAEGKPIFGLTFEK